MSLAVVGPSAGWRSGWFLALFKSLVSLATFCLLVLSIGNVSVLKSPTVTVNGLVLSGLPVFAESHVSSMLLNYNFKK